MANPLRTVVTEHLFDAERRKIEPSVPRFDALMAGIMWALARDPSAVGQQASNSKVWYMQAGGSADCPNLYIFYTFNTTHVFLLSIQLASAGNGHS
jgi:hypothetical protein